MYRDYSLRKRLPNREKLQSAADKLKVGDKKKKDTEVSKLQCLEVAIEDPICNVEWVNIAEIINHVKGLCWFQVLPVGQKSCTPYQFNAIHLLPQSKIPFPLPIELFLKNNESNERKIERRNLKGDAVVEDEARNQFELAAKSQGLIVLPEFQFKHCIYKLTEQSLSSEGLLYAYTKCAVFLGLKDNDHAGVTMLLTDKWMMVAELDKPYMTTGSGVPCYLDGFAYAGILQLQNVEKVWPQTAGHDLRTVKIFDSLQAQGSKVKEIANL